MSIDLILEYIDKKRTSILKDTGSFETLSKQSASKKVSDSLTETVSDKVWSKISNSPVAQMGKDFIGEQIAKNGTQIVNNVDTAIKSKIKKPVEQVQNLVFDSITAALTAQNDLALFFIQEMAKQILLTIEKKRQIVVELQEKLTELHNILILLTTTNPFFDKYLYQLRQALILVYSGRNDLSVGVYTLNSNEKWLKTRYEQAQDKFARAEAMMQPQGKEPDVKFTDKGLLAGVGVPSEPQQLTLLLALPQKVKEVLLCANGYFIVTAKLNALLLAFIQAHSSFTNSASRKLKQFTINTLTNIVTKLDDLISSMATQLNGSPTSVLKPDMVQSIVPNPEIIASARAGVATSTTEVNVTSSKEFQPDTIKTSAAAINWLIELKTIVAYMEVIPGPTLAALDVSNDALEHYTEACTLIKSKNTRTVGDAVLTATEGREEIGQLERQLSTFLLAAAKGLVDIERARAVLPLGRTLIKRLDLTIAQDKEIYDAVSRFATADLSFPSAVKKAGDNIFKMLDKFGLDRASDLLRNGEFSKFFNLNGKTATYAGAAITAFSVLKECLTTEEDREQLTQAQREIEREMKSKELIAQRTASSGFQQQINEIKAEDKKLETLSQRTEVSAKKCGLPSDMAPSSLLKNVGPLVGLSALGSKGIQDKILKIGKGVL